MRVLGVDCGSQTTGYGIIDSDGHCHRVVDFGGIRTKRQNDFAQKLLSIHERLRQLIELHLPQAVAVEDQFYLNNFRSVLKLGEVKGVVLLTAAQAGLPVFEYSPLEVKSAVTGYGHAAKSQVQVMVRNLLNLNDLPHPHDAADALALAICHTLHQATNRRLKSALDPRCK
ncbi:MAG: crossover junction endodeoxyribonuclease RuvC [Acidobacteriota bacterium]